MMPLRRPAAWQALATEVLDEVVAAYARYGVAVSPALRLAPQGGPIPTYEVASEQIRFAVPNPETNLGRLTLLFYQNLLGATDLPDVEVTIAATLPMVLAHEVGHHLRHRYDVVAASLWREEQVVQLMAMALVAEHPRFGCTLDAIERVTRRMVRRLTEIATKRGALNPARLRAGYGTLAHRLLAEGLLAEEEIEEAERYAALTDQSLADVLVDEGRLSETTLARLLRSATLSERHFNATYMDEVTEYWLAGTTWMLPHLERRDWPPLGKLVEDFLRTDDWEARQWHEARYALWGALHHERGAIAAAAARSLAELEGEAARDTLLRARERVAPPVQRAIDAALRSLDGPPAAPRRPEAPPPNPDRLRADLDALRERQGWAAALAQTPLGDALAADCAARLERLLPGLSHEGDAATLARVRPLLRHPDPLVRKQAREMLLAACPAALRAALHAAVYPPDTPPDRDAALAAARAVGSWPAALADLPRPPSEPAMLTRAEKLIYLRAVPVFAALDPDHLWTLSGKAVLQQVAAGETIYEENSPGDRLYVVTRGRVALWTQGKAAAPILVRTVEAGESFGVMTLFDTEPHAFAARATEPTWLLWLERDDLTALALEEPTMLLGIIQQLAHKVRELDRRLEER